MFILLNKRNRKLLLVRRFFINHQHIPFEKKILNTIYIYLHKNFRKSVLVEKKLNMVLELHEHVFMQAYVIIYDKICIMRHILYIKCFVITTIS